MSQDPTPQTPSPASTKPLVVRGGTSAPSGSGARLGFWLVVAVLVAILFPHFFGMGWNGQVRLNWAALLAIAPNLADKFGNPWEFPVHSVLGLVTGVALLAALFGLGYGLVSWVRPWRRMLPAIGERAALALPVAAMPASLGVLGLGLAGLANAGALGGWLALLLAAGVPGWVRFFSEFRRARRHGVARGVTCRPVLIVTLLAIILGLSIIYALAPATESDELRYHLAAPATWLRDGRIHYLPYQAFSNFPMLGEMLFMLVMPLGGAEAAKLIHWGFLPVCMGLIALIARRLIAPARRGYLPFLAASAFALIPTVPIIAAWGFIDLFVVAYFLSFVYLAGRALQRPRRASGSLIGVIGGGAISVKYTLIALLGGLGVIWTLWLAASRPSRRHVARLAGLTVLFTILCGGAWYARNFAWTGNPVYPGAIKLLGGGEWTPDNQARFVAKTKEKGMNLTGLPGGVGRAVEFFISPVTTAFFPDYFEFNLLGPLPLMALVIASGGMMVGGERRGARKSGRVGPLRGPDHDSTLTPGCAALHPGLLKSATPAGSEISDFQLLPETGIRNVEKILRESRRNIFLIWTLAGVFVSWAAWFITYQSNRFLLPTVALVLPLGARAVAKWQAILATRHRRILNILLTLGFVYCFLFTLAQFLAPWGDRFRPQAMQVNKSDTIAVALGFEDRTIYLAHKLNYWPAAQWLARQARPGEKVLLVGEYRTLHFNLPVVASDWFDTPQPIPWMQKSQNNDEMLDLLLKNGVRTILYNKAELGLGGQFTRYFLPRFSPAEQQRFMSLWENPRLKQIYPAAEREGVMIYEILPR